MSKTLLATVLSLMLVFLLAGCGGDAADTAEGTAKTDAAEAHSEHPTSDAETAEHPTADKASSEHPTDEHPAADADSTGGAEHPKSDHPK